MTEKAFYHLSSFCKLNSVKERLYVNISWVSLISATITFSQITSLGPVCSDAEYVTSRHAMSMTGIPGITCVFTEVCSAFYISIVQTIHVEGKSDVN